MKREDPALRWTNYLVAVSGCWEWQGYADKNGYGRVFDAARPKGEQIQWAHRAFYERHKGTIPPGHEIDHVCCNTICVNPGHLEAVTKKEHARRTHARLGSDDRHRRAAYLRSIGLTYAEIAEVLGFGGKEAAHSAVKTAISKGLVTPDSVPRIERLSADQREEIRELHAFGIPQRELAAWYRVDNSQISRICNGKTGGRRKAGDEGEAA